MGLSSSKTKTSSTSTTTPQPPSWLTAPYQDIAGRAQGLLSADPTSFLTAPNNNQTSAWARAGAGSGASAAISNLLGYTPGNVTAGTVNPGLLKDVDLSAYMNPYTQNVIDTSVNDLDRARRMAITGNSANATLAQGGNAFLSDRAGVADSETNRGFLDQVGALTANLRNQGYNTAQQGAMYDIGNRLSADTGNRDAALNAGQFNVNSGLAGAQLRLGAANDMGNQYRADTAAMGDAGTQERAIQAENNPQNAYLRQLALIQALLQGVPIEAFTGQTTNSSGTTKSSPSLISSLSSILQGAGGFLGGIGGLGGR